MSLRLTLAAAALLAVAAPAVAQQAPPAPPAAPAAPAPSPEEAALMANVQTAGEALQAVMVDLEPRAAAVRADAALSAADKESRIRAMLAEHQPVLDQFSEALKAMVLFKASEEGASPDEAEQAATMVGGMVATQIAQGLLTGESPDDAAGE
jgi:hypothetical protein